MVSGVKVSNQADMSPQRSRQTWISREKLKKAEMTESEGIQAIVNQVAVQVVTTMMMVVKDAEVGPRPTTNTTSPRQPQRHGRPALEKPSFKWNVQERYIELPNFEIEVKYYLHDQGL